MNILGLTAPISANTAACIIRDGELVAFVEEERFIGLKHAPKMMPKKSIDYCLNSAGITLDEVDYIAIGFDGPLKSGAKNLLQNVREANFSRLVRETGAYAEYFIGSVCR
jgi:carbamoyltransferase